ncbi:thiol:disulfide interchange protein DsbA/DsbL [Paraglaciecola sp. L3A3]|uniref:thiol:disulfide interchange protein DsbA/DsbL n=1 Tax=Paraglaciecola sp. L3A3 TaxID=2686358 RepID=UPI00131BBD54|nr:thiol:disulfide interchange protein DsbA/DsbL [Paraglaciecola sp. L3A3]
MKKILLAILVTLILPLQACAQEQWKEGEHYEVINDKATEKREIVEFFSFWCPHCFNFEPIVKNVKTKLDKDVSFTKVHVNFMGFTSAQIQDDATTAMLIGRALKKEDAMNQAIFKYIHVQKSSITGLKDLQNIFIVNGVEPADFDKMAKSFGVKSMVNKNNKTIAEYRRHVSSVPSFIVNGKFKATFTRDMTADDMADLLAWLTRQK